MGICYHQGVYFNFLECRKNLAWLLESLSTKLFVKPTECCRKTNRTKWRKVSKGRPKAGAFLNPESVFVSLSKRSIDLYEAISHQRTRINRLGVCSIFLWCMCEARKRLEGLFTACDFLG